jgi:hypothetical protein
MLSCGLTPQLSREPLQEPGNPSAIPRWLSTESDDNGSFAIHPQPFTDAEGTFVHLQEHDTPVALLATPFDKSVLYEFVRNPASPPLSQTQSVRQLAHSHRTVLVSEIQQRPHQGGRNGRRRIRSHDIHISKSGILKQTKYGPAFLAANRILQRIVS